ncbi:MAG: hypothetical protein JXB60_06325 [Candidatus Cloacimonetes bacterium]|nr:hypothetical protein [Candidatus Cloacimonadota bacterium]
MNYGGNIRYGRVSVILWMLPMLISVQLSAYNQITSLQGGSHRITGSIYCSYFTGAVAGLAQFGNSVSSLSTDPVMAAVNPAALARIGAKRLCLEITPPFLFNLNGIYDVNPVIKDHIDDIKILQDDIIYPFIDLEGGQVGGLNTMAFSYPVSDRDNLGFSYHTPLLIDLDVIGNGMSGTFYDTDDGDTTRVALSGELYGKFKAGSHTLDIAYARKFSDRIAGGLALNIMNFTFNGDLALVIDGTIRRCGEDTDITKSFNDPVDGANFRNTLNDSARCDVKGKIITATLGINYLVSQRIMLDFVLSLPSRKDLQGDFLLVKHSLGAVDIRGLTDEEVELLDQTQIEPSRMTYTNRTAYHSQRINFQTAGKIALAAGFSNSNLDVVISYEKPLRAWLLTFSSVVHEDGREKVGSEFENYDFNWEKTYELGLYVKNIYKLGMKFKKKDSQQKLVLGIQLFDVDTVIDNFSLKEKENIKPMKNLLIPSLNLGLEIPIYSNLLWNLNLISFPFPYFRISWQYDF